MQAVVGEEHSTDDEPALELEQVSGAETACSHG